MKITRRQLRRIIREEKARILEMHHDADTFDPRMYRLLEEIKAAVGQLLDMGMDPDSLQDELDAIKVEVRDYADFEYYDDLANEPEELEKGMYNENYKKTT